jgi:hypothetical protein
MHLAVLAFSLPLRFAYAAPGVLRRGKSTLLNMMAMGTSIQTVPTVGLSVKTMKHAGVSMKVRARPGRRRFCDQSSV